MGYGVEEEYRPGPTAQVRIAGGRYTFVAWMAPRDSGGHDLLLDPSLCNLSALQPGQVSKLRNCAVTYGRAIVSFFWDRELTPDARQRAVAALVQWCEKEIAVTLEGEYSVQWTVAEFDC